MDAHRLRIMGSFTLSTCFRKTALALLCISTTSASPLPHRHLYSRSAPSRRIGVGIAIAISVIIFAAIVFYLGMWQGRTGTWYCWRDPDSAPSTLETSVPQLSKPLPPRPRQGSPARPIIGKEISAPLELSPVETTSRFLELPGESPVYELGEGRRNWFSGILERRSWFSNGGDRRSWWRSRNNSLYEMEGSSVPPVPPLPVSPPPGYPEKAKFSSTEISKEEEIMDWGDMEYMKKVYAGRGTVHRPVDQK